jgi:hypothetical protein
MVSPLKEVLYLGCFDHCEECTYSNSPVALKLIFFLWKLGVYVENPDEGTFVK